MSRQAPPALSISSGRGDVVVACLAAQGHPAARCRLWQGRNGRRQSPRPPRCRQTHDRWTGSLVLPETEDLDTARLSLLVPTASH